MHINILVLKEKIEIGINERAIFSNKTFQYIKNLLVLLKQIIISINNNY